MYQSVEADNLQNELRDDSVISKMPNFESKKGRQKQQAVRKIVKSVANHVDEIVNFVASQPSNSTADEQNTRVEETEMDKKDYQEEIELHKKIEEQNEMDKVMSVHILAHSNKCVVDSTESLLADSSDYSEPDDVEEKSKKSSRKNLKPTQSSGPYKCKSCQNCDEFISKSDYNQHLLKIHNIKVAVCQPRQKKGEHLVDTVKKGLLKHVQKSHSLEKVEKCSLVPLDEIQGKVEKVKESLCQGVGDEKISFKCESEDVESIASMEFNSCESSDESEPSSEEDICNAEFQKETKTTYSKQTKVYKKYSCDKCNQILTSRSEYKQHRESQHGVKFRVHRPPQWKREKRIYSCEECSTGFQVMKVYVQHMKELHKQNKPFKCTLCLARFVTLRSVRRHSAEFHNPHGRAYPYKGYFVKQKQKFICIECGTEFANKSQLYKHARLVHDGANGWVCEHCGETLSSAGSLSEHTKRIHSIEHTYACDRCPKKFPVKQSLKEHMFSHVQEGSKPYVCEVCGKTFARKRCMIRHLDTHSEDRQFACEECGKTFKQKVNLNAHMRLHKDIRPFHCWVCSKMFTQGSNLKSHLKTHTVEERTKPDLLGTPMEL